MEQQQLFKVRDKRKKEWFWLDNQYFNGYARIFGPIGTAIYLSLCRHADNETQKCYPSEKTIAEEINITDRTARKYIKLFQKYRLIEITKERNNQGKWLNNTYWLLDKSEWVKPEEIVSDGLSQRKMKAEPEENESRARGTPVPLNNTHINNTYINNTHSNAIGIAGIINCFKDVSPNNYKKWFGIPAQRKAVENLLKSYSYEQLEKIIKFLPRINSMPYTSKDCKAFSPYELDKNVDKIKARTLQEKLKVVNKGLKVSGL